MHLSAIWGHVCTFCLAFSQHPHNCFTSQSSPRKPPLLQGWCKCSTLHIVNIPAVFILHQNCCIVFHRLILLHRIWSTGWLLWTQMQRFVPCSNTSSLTLSAWGETCFFPISLSFSEEAHNMGLTPDECNAHTPQPPATVDWRGSVYSDYPAHKAWWEDFSG